MCRFEVGAMYGGVRHHLAPWVLDSCELPSHV